MFIARPMRRMPWHTAAATLEREVLIGAARLPQISSRLSPATKHIALSHRVSIRPFSSGPHRSFHLPPWVAMATLGVSMWAYLLIPSSTYFWGFDHVVVPVVCVLAGAEDAQSFVRWALAKGLLPKLSSYRPGLNGWKSGGEGVYVMEKTWKPHLGVAAAMDPEGDAVPGLSCLGLSFVEIGPITLKPQDGDMMAHRKALMVGDRAPVDRYVVPSQGAVKTYCQLKKWRETEQYIDAVLLVHVAPNDDSDDPADDIRRGMEWLVNVADYFVVSFPSSTLNLPRDKRVEAMKSFCTDIGAKPVDTDRPWYRRDTSTPPKPLLLKLQSDLSVEQLHDIASVAVGHDVSGLVVCGNMRAGGASAEDGNASRTAANDLVGLKEVSTHMVREMYALTGGKLPIIASGGVATADDAYEKIRAGASLVQVGQALLIDQGLGSVFKLREGLIDLAYADCHKKIEHAIGADHRDKKAVKKQPES